MFDFTWNYSNKEELNFMIYVYLQVVYNINKTSWVYQDFTLYDSGKTQEKWVRTWWRGSNITKITRLINFLHANFNSVAFFCASSRKTNFLIFCAHYVRKENSAFSWNWVDFLLRGIKDSLRLLPLNYFLRKSRSNWLGIARKLPVHGNLYLYLMLL